MQNNQRCPCGGTFVSQFAGTKYACGNCQAAFGRVENFVCIEEGKKKGPKVGQHVFAKHVGVMEHSVAQLSGRVGDVMEQLTKMQTDMVAVRRLLSNNRIDDLEGKLGVLRRDMDTLKEDCKCGGPGELSKTQLSQNPTQQNPMSPK